jgi:hypothetical protein
MMETHPDKPGVVEILSGETNPVQRMLLIAALCLLATLAIVATEVLFR